MESLRILFIFSSLSYAVSYVVKIYHQDAEFKLPGDHKDAEFNVPGAKVRKDLERDVDDQLERDLNSVYKQLVLQQEKRSNEACLSDCSSYKPDDYHCGTNGKTYPNICVLYNAACKSATKFQSKGKGKCKRRDEISHVKDAIETCITDCSPYTEKVEYCGTNGETYPNICELYNAVCRSGATFDMKGKGACKTKDEISHVEDAAETCITDCSPYKTKVEYCGTNGVTYPNICELYNAICKSGETFDMKGKGACARRDETSYEKGAAGFKDARRYGSLDKAVRGLTWRNYYKDVIETNRVE